MHILQNGFVTVKRKVKLSYHKKKNCVAGARNRDFLVLAFPLHVKGVFRHPKRRYSKMAPVRNFMKTPAYSYHKSYSACRKRDDIAFR